MTCSLDAIPMLIVWLMFTTPLPDEDVGTIAKTFYHMNTPVMMGHCQQMALGLELIGPNETRYTFFNKEWFFNDVKCIRQRYVEMKDAPPLADYMRYPSRDDIQNYMTMNRQYYRYLEHAGQLHWDKEWFREARVETDKLYYIYDSVRDAACEHQHITTRRQALKHLKDKLGVDYYHAGYLPPCVPVWRFEKVN